MFFHISNAYKTVPIILFENIIIRKRKVVKVKRIAKLFIFFLINIFLSVIIKWVNDTMLNKLYEKFIKFIRENYKDVIILILLCLFLFFPLNYSIMISGGTIDIKDRVAIENSYNIKGSYSLAYVKEHKGTPCYVLLSYIIPSWKKVPLEEYQANKNETDADILNRAKVYLEYSKQAAIKNAYLKAGKSFEIRNEKSYVVYISEKASTDIKIGDIIKKADGVSITKMEQYREIISNHDIGDTINVVVEREKKDVECTVKIKKIDGEKLTGITVLSLYDYETDPNIELTFKNNESGSSGGLMLTLAIYDKLIKEDLTKGYKIVGTGTIDFDGNVGEIDGVEYKLRGAVKSKAKIFIAPSGNNYNDAVKLKNKNNYNIEIIEAKTFEQVLSELKNIK